MLKVKPMLKCFAESEYLTGSTPFAKGSPYYLNNREVHCANDVCILLRFECLFWNPDP